MIVIINVLIIMYNYYLISIEINNIINSIINLLIKLLIIYILILITINDTVNDASKINNNKFK